MQNLDNVAGKWTGISEADVPERNWGRAAQQSDKAFPGRQYRAQRTRPFVSVYVNPQVGEKNDGGGFRHRCYDCVCKKVVLQPLWKKECSMPALTL